MMDMNILKIHWGQFNFQHRRPKCWTILIYVLVLNSMMEQTQGRCCLEYEGKKCKACPEGTHLYRNNCILEIQNCQRHYGVTCLSCRRYYKLNNQKTRCLIPQNTTINLFGFIQLDISEIQKPGINRIFQGIKTNLSNYRNAKFQRIYYRPQNLQNPQIFAYLTQTVIYRVIFSFESGIGEKIYRFIPANPQRNTKEDLKQLYSSDNFTRLNQKSILNEKGRKGIEEFYNQFNLSSVVWLTGADIIDIFRSIIPKEENNKPYFSLNRVVFLPNINSYVIASQLQTPVNFTVIKERITLRSPGEKAIASRQPISESTPSILKPVDNKISSMSTNPVEPNNKPDQSLLSIIPSPAKNISQKKPQPKSFKALNSIIPTKKPISPKIMLYEQTNSQTFTTTKIFEQINKKYLKKYFLSRINGQNLIKLASGNNQTHTIVQLVYKINQYKSQIYEYYTFSLNWQNYQIQLNKLFTVVSSSPLIVRTNNFREYNLLTQYKDQQTLDLIDIDISRMLALIKNDSEYIQIMRITDSVVQLAKLTVIEFVDFSNGNQQDNLTRFKRFTFKFYLQLASSDKWSSYQFIQYRYEKVLEDPGNSISNSQIYSLPKILFMKQNYTDIQKLQNFTSNEIFRIRKNILTQLRFFSGQGDQVLLMSLSRSQVYRIYILNDTKLYKYQMYPPIIGQPFLFSIESVQKSTRLLFQKDKINDSKSERVQKVQFFFNPKVYKDQKLLPKQENHSPYPIVLESQSQIKDKDYIKKNSKTFKTGSRSLPLKNPYLRISQKIQETSLKQHKAIKKQI